jgi:hypothetical protein
MGIAAGDDSKALAPPSNSRKSVSPKMACRVVEGPSFGIGLNALGHLPQQVVATVDVADEVNPPAIRDPTLTRSWSGRFPKPLRERIDPRQEFGPHPLGLMLTTLMRPSSPPCKEAHSKPFWVPIFQRTGGACNF